MLLPEPLKFDDGLPLTTVAQWRSRREELLEHFRRAVYGSAPDKRSAMKAINEDVKQTTSHVRKIITLDFDGKLRARVLLYAPVRSAHSPCFLSMNFIGNQSCTMDADVPIQTGRVMGIGDGSIINDRATESSRGKRCHYLPHERIVARGYACATVCCADFEADFGDGWQTGIRGLFGWDIGNSGAIGCWAWGLSRVLDYLLTDPLIDGSRVAVMGHSRMGKTALWAAAQDERFALAISNDSGQGGATISRRRVGETIGDITRVFPHWFCKAHASFERRESELPIDQHELIALIAPRPVYVASAADDHWADPEGEQLAAIEARRVYDFLQPGTGVTHVGQHVRPGKHSVEAIDWQHFLSFADRHWVDK
jgi:hypothetical protein